MTPRVRVGEQRLMATMMMGLVMARRTPASGLGQMGMGPEILTRRTAVIPTKRWCSQLCVDDLLRLGLGLGPEWRPLRRDSLKDSAKRATSGS